MKTKYHNKLNGVYYATKNKNNYLTKFINGKSVEGLKNNVVDSGNPYNDFFSVSAFTATSGYEYEEANTEDTLWLEECIRSKKFVDKNLVHMSTINNLLIFN